MPVIYLAPEEARPAVYTIVQQVQQGQTVTTEIANQHRDCTVFPVRVTAAPDPTDANHMIVMVEDISAEVQRRSEAEAIAAERRRIAHEIHDGVAQSLAGLRFKSALWYHLAEEVPPGMCAALEELQTVLDIAIVDLRRAIFALRPLDLEALGFFPALEQLVSDFGHQNQVAATLEAPETGAPLPAAYELPLFRILQEGLNNITRHAQASSVHVRLIIDADGKVCLSISDNGHGFDPGQLAPTGQADHFGLLQMRERILDLGGTLDVHSAAGRGTELVISLPPIAHGTEHGAD
jgi:two-component system sensor histidine kinase DegS